MAVYKRSNVYWASFTGPDGRRVQRSTGTRDKAAAQELHDKWRVEVWRVTKLGERPRRRWQEAVVRWLRETTHKAGHEEDRRNLRWLDQHLNGVFLDEITRDVIERVTQARLSGGVANATCNRTLAVMRAILRRAANDWEWVDRVPKIRLLPEPKRRVRWITREEADRLLQELPVHLAEMVRFTLATGLRLRNVTHLEWSNVDLSRRVAWVHADQAKNRKPLGVPLNAEAVTVLRRLEGKHPRYVFTFRGRAPVAQANGEGWRDAVRRAGLRDFRWHDLRHTWASWHAQAGTPLHALQELGGWETAAMVRRYAHLAPEHLAEHAERIARPRLVSGGDVIATPSGASKNDGTTKAQ